MNSRSKYRSRKVTRDGMTFDSVKEYSRYKELRLLERAGAISDLRRQVRYELIPAQRIEGKVVEKSITYRADFVYQREGETVVEDVKGFRTDVYIIKRKLMLYIHGIKIQDI